MNTIKTLTFLLCLTVLTSPLCAKTQKQDNTPEQNRVKQESSEDKEKSPKYPPLTEDRLIKLAKEDFIALLREMIAYYDKNIKDYKGIFHKQERIDGELQNPQTMKFKFRQKPFSVFMEWLKNPAGADRMLYVEGKHGNKMLVHPSATLLGWIKSVKKDPRDKDVLKKNLRTVDEFGIRNLMDRIHEIAKTAKKEEALNYKILKTNKEEEKKKDKDKEKNKRPTIVFELKAPENQDMPTKKAILVIDIGHRLPVAVTSFGEKNELISTYKYESLEFNTGLTDKDFSKKENNL